MALQHLRSSTANKRPDPTAMAEGQLALNTANASPGLFYKDATGSLIKSGPVHIGATAPNATPAAGGHAGNSVGEAWLDTSGTNPLLKIYNGASFVTVQPVASGTVVSTADTGTVTSTMILDGTILNADINASAAIVDTKLATIATGGKVSGTAITSGNISTSGSFTSTSTVTGTNLIPTGSGVPTNGIYLPAANQVAAATNGTGRLFINSTGLVGIGTSSPAELLDVSGAIKHGSVGYIANGDLGFIYTGTSNNTYGTVIGTKPGTTYSTGRSFTVSLNPSLGPGREVFRIEGESGRVGIGTTSPSEALHVKSTSGTQLVLERDGTTTQIASVVFKDGSGDQNRISSSDSNLIFESGAGNTERARIDSSGRLLVGTTTGSQSLTIKDGGDAEALGLYRNFTGAGAAGVYMRMGRTDSGGVLRYTGSIGCESSNNGTTPGGTLTFSTTADGASPPAERMRIDSSGHLNLVSASSALTNLNFTESLLNTYARIEGGKSGSGVGDLRFHTYSGGLSEKMRITSAGNVGIGTTSPGYLLHLIGSTPGVAVQDSGANGTRALVEATNSAVYFGSTYSTSNVPTIFSQAGASGGIERMRIDTLGRLLVGTSTATKNLRGEMSTAIVGTGDNTSAGLAVTGYCGTPAAAYPLIDIQRSRGTTDGSMTVVASGDKLGAFSFRGADGSNFITAASIEGEVDGTPGTNDMPGRLVFSTTADGASSPTERMRIRNNGAVRIFATTNAPSATQAGIELLGNSSGTTAFSAGVTTTSFNQILFYNGNGIVGSIVTSGSATAYNTSSDYRLKENVTNVTDGITRLQQLKPSRFNFIADSDKTVDGFIAHEVQTVVPEAIIGEKDAVDDAGNPVYQGIDQSKLVPLLTAALQEAVAEIKALKDRVTALESA